MPSNQGKHQLSCNLILYQPITVIVKLHSLWRPEPSVAM